MEWNRPKILIVVALFFTLCTGASQPFFAIFLSKILTYLSVPRHLIPYMTGDFSDTLEDLINFYCIIIGIFAVATFLSMFFQKYIYLKLSENVTYEMRHTLYNTILSKHIGWFDLRENSVGVLSSSMAQDTSLVNGVSSESLGPVAESSFAMLCGCTIGFIYCW